MKSSLITAFVVFFAGSAAIGQVAGMAAPTATVGATSPLGVGPSSGVGGTGIPLGATEIASPGVSPLPTVAPPAGAATSCTTAGVAPSTMYGSNATYDGGGLSLATSAPTSMATSGATSNSGATAGSAIPATTTMIDTSGLSSMCGSGATNPAASSTPTSMASGSGRGVGIPLGSTELSNLGISTSLAVPAPIEVPMATTAVQTNTMMPAASSPSSATGTSSTTASTVP